MQQQIHLQSDYHVFNAIYYSEANFFSYFLRTSVSSIYIINMNAIWPIISKRALLNFTF